MTLNIPNSGEVAAAAIPFRIAPLAQGWSFFGTAFNASSGTVSVGSFRQSFSDWECFTFPNAHSFWAIEDPAYSSFKIESSDTVSTGNALFWFGFQNNVARTYAVFVGNTI